ncbi:serine/arginine repetitive matrix protein 2-like isoform X2 [Littorina saxatilis]|uniref:AKNA n=1 Tax=Littorina saxatilis TaxID=31220 RepID=A0AAN9G472_9CAEN
MALTGMSDDFDLDDHGILRDSFASDFQVDDDGILHDDLDLFKHAVNTAGHGTDSGFGGDKQSSTSTLQHMHASFDDDLAPIGDESINISDFEASRDDLDSFEGDVDGRDKRSKSRGYRGSARDLDTPGSTLERPLDVSKETGASAAKISRQKAQHYGEDQEDQDLFSESYYQQLRELGVLVDGADFSRDESQQDFEALESHLSREQIDYDDENRDLIGEYLQDQYERERRDEEDEEVEEERVADGKGRRNRSYAVPNSRASSAMTISGQSFPEISPEDAEMMYTESQQTGDDDEIFLINRHLIPGSAHIQAQKLPDTPGPDSRPNSRGVQPQTPGQQNAHSRRTPSPSRGGNALRSRSAVNTPHKARPDSAASAASENNRPQSAASSPGKSAMSKARSQESFFEHDKQPSKSGSEKIPKRLLPTPSAPDTNQSFRVKSKSKSVSNINKSAPVKPTHMSLAEITRATMDETEDGAVDRSQGELSTQLKQESSKRKQATELVQQLQKEYDSLLSKYAMAELTIDQFRLGARITLHSDSPTPNSAHSGPPVSPGTKKAQVMSVQQPSAQRAVVGHFGSGAGNGPSLSTAQIQTADVNSRSASRADKPLVGGHDNVDGDGVFYESEDRTSSKQPVSAETLKVNIQQQAASLNGRLDQFHTLMENRQLTLEEQEKAFENIRTDHEKLRRSYLQAKEDYNVLRRSGAGLPDGDFDGNKELEGQLFRLGMKFDEVHEHVDSNVREQTTRRKPFQSGRLADDQADQDASDDSQGPEQGVEKTDGATGGGNYDAEFEKRAGHLNEEYRALMDRYRRLKQMAPTPDMEKETDNLVRKLQDICNEMPEMFRLPPEVQERWERLHRRDQRRSPLPQGGQEVEHRGLPSLPPNSKMHGSSLVGDHSISPYVSGRQGGRDDSFHRTASSSRSSLVSPRDHNSSTAALPSSDMDGRASPSSVDGAAAPRDRDGYDARINRPRRHRHDFRDPKLSKRPDRGSYSSLPDSGISDQEGRERRPDSALAHLPGPGKMKQMTRQRGENDMDSGFIGSVVSAEGGQIPPRDFQPEAPLRLRDRAPADRNQNRLDSSASSSTIGSVQRELDTVRRSRKPPAAPVGQHSIDRSYDAELDESTISDRDVRLKGVRPKEQTTSSQTGSRQQQRGRKGEEGSLRSQSSRSTRSQLHSTQEDETLEDVSDAEMTDISTPRPVQPSQDSSNKESSTQHASPISRRPPTPLRPATPQRPPTPYRAEGKEAAEADLEESETVPKVSTTRSGRMSDDEVVQRRSQQQRKSRSPAPLRPEEEQRPVSRGEPTTDLYHTRPRRQRSRDRSADRDSAFSAESSRPGSRYSRRNSEQSEQIRGEDRAVGSDVEVNSNATQGSSVHSGRLRALQDEIERLKIGVQQANDKASERQAPQQPEPPQQPQEPEYYDPFDDPYGFMRMPRRRAASFSGRHVRDFEEWYGPNQQRHNDDIPLGYAAADAYNRNYRAKTPEAARQRLRRRHDRRRHSEDPRVKTMEDGGGGEAETMAPPPPVGATPHVHRPPITDPQALYNYYVPSRQGIQQGAPAANPYRQHTTPLSASQPNLAGTLSGIQPATYQYQASQARPWYQIRRASSGQYYPTTGARNAVLQPAAHTQPAAYYSAYPVAGHATPAQIGVDYRTELCPLCGGAGPHIHEEDVVPVSGYASQDFATQPGHQRKGRTRSRSVPRARHYTPERSSSSSRYLIREFGDSASDESDIEFSRGRQRSRSLSRSRGHSETRSSARSSSRRRGRRYGRKTDRYDSDEEVDLNETLVLSEDINRLTKRMIGTVRGELKHHKDRTEFGSSYW